MTDTLKRIGKFAKRHEATIAILGLFLSYIIWSSGFVTAREMDALRTDLHGYVDVRHVNVQGELEEIKGMLKEQRELSNKILLRVSR